MTTTYTSGRFQAFDSNGDPLAGGKLYSYAAGTTTPQATYTSSTLATPNANPVILDAAGRAPVWLSDLSYRMVLKTAGDVTITDDDNVGLSVTGSAYVTFVQSGAGAVSRTMQSKGRDIIDARDFGVIGDADEAKATANSAGIAAALAEIEAQEDGYGVLVLPPGRIVINAPIVVERGVTIRGAGSTDSNGATQIRGAHLYGPIIRVKGSHVCLENFTVASTTARRGATRVTAATYAGLGLTRDDFNFGIWVEGDDDSGADVGDLYMLNVWSHNQPNDAIVIVGACYGGVLMKCGVNSPIGHGIVVDKGIHTGRTVTQTPGVMRIDSAQAYGCRGHALLVGNPSDATPPVRVLVDNFDEYNCATDATIRINNYQVWFYGDNSHINNSAVDGAGSTSGGIYIGGRNSRLVNNRYLETLQPVFVSNIGARITTGLLVDGILVTGTQPWTWPVNINAFVTNVAVRSLAFDGGYTDVADEIAIERQLNDTRKWTGSLEVANNIDSRHFLSKAITIADDGFAVVTPRFYSGFMFISISNSLEFPNSNAYAMIYYDCGSSVSVVKLAGGTELDVVGTALTGTTGTDGQVTVGSPGGGVIHIENRDGGERQIYYTFLN